MQQLLTNPIIVRALLAFVFALALLIVAVALIRRLRQSASTESEKANEGAKSESQFPIEAYYSVLQTLKEQEKELQRLRSESSSRSSAQEDLGAVLLANLTSGVVLFNNLGTVQQANGAAKAILGYASPVGFHARDLFKGVTSVRYENGEKHETGIAFQQTLQMAIGQGTAFRRMEVEYTTPAGDKRYLGVTLSPLRATLGEGLGAACLVSDLTEIMRLQRQLGGGAPGSALQRQLQNSIAQIITCAEALATSPDEISRVMGRQILEEAERLNAALAAEPGAAASADGSSPA